jgi:hypothetical protein
MKRYKKHVWAFAVVYAGWKFFLALAGARRYYESYPVNLFYYTDILLNALAGGHPDITVSARTGRYAAYYGDRGTLTAKFWNLMEWMIDTTFYPLDGVGHCKQAYEWTMENVKNPDGTPAHIQHGPAWLFVPLLAISSIACFFIFFILRFLKLIKMLPY